MGFTKLTSALLSAFTVLLMIVHLIYKKGNIMQKRRSLIKIKPKKYKTGDIVKVSFMVMHPMDTGLSKDKKTKEIIPLHYINDVKFSFNDTVFTTMKTWETLSVNPVMSVNYKVTGKGKIKVVFTDNQGEHQEISKKIKPKD
jgi:sulfur-oxidizing protein SoxZ